jgi:hypothetical protein
MVFFGLFHVRVTERISMLQKLDTKQGGQRIEGTPTLLTGLSVVGLDQVDQRLQSHHTLEIQLAKQLQINRPLIIFAGRLGGLADRRTKTRRIQIRLDYERYPQHPAGSMEPRKVLPSQIS